MIRNLFLTIIILLTGTSAAYAAELYDLMYKDFWRNPGSNVVFSPEKIICTGQTFLRSRDPIEIVPGRKYKFTMKVRGNSDEDTYFWAGIDPANEKGASIPARAFQSNPRSLTRITRHAKKGSRTIYVQNASAWKVSIYACIMNNVKSDLSDIPNLNTVASNISKIEKAGKEWKITLGSGLSKDLPAGTMIRQHFNGGYCYILAINKKIAIDSEQVFSAEIKDIAPHGLYSSRKWPRNVKYAYIVILADWRNSQTPVEISEASLLVE